MDHIQLLKNRLLQYNNIPELKELLINFAEYENVLNNQQDAFVQASINTNLSGPESLKLSLRFQAEKIIKKVLEEMGVSVDIDCITPVLMAIPKEIYE